MYSLKPKNEIECTLPKFKDKVMYVSTSDNKEQSYSISASFKGILRLSPNNLNSIYETSNMMDVPEEFVKIDTNYSDAIVFEGDASINSFASIDRRMIFVSDSDSYAVDLRISKTGVEFNNLNVVGISKFKHLTLFHTDDGKKSPPFKMGNTIMPYLHNILGDKTITHGKDYDVKDIDVKSADGDNSYILFGNDSNGERVFKYQKTKRFIEELVKEALLDLQTIPTGSIHFVPVSLSQYLTLMGDNKPNVYTSDNDPIIRDFLLCDGRRYNSRDFPELAKVLWNETVDYWRSDGGDYLHRYESINTFSKTEGEEKTFRVPDLRRMFISSIYAKGIDGYTENAKIDKDEKIGSNVNRAGHWMPDNIPLGDEGDIDNHFHFIAYGTYSPIVSYHSSNYKHVKSNAKFTKVADDGSGVYEGYIEMNANPAILTLTNHLSWSYYTKLGPGFGTGVGGLRRRDYWGYEPFPAIAYMAGPRTTENNIKNYNYSAPSVGRTSLSMSNVLSETNTNDEAYGTEKNKLNGETYVSLDENLYGYENSPKFFACLPLIKI